MKTRFFYSLLLLVIISCQTTAQEGKFGKIIGVQNGRLSQQITGFKPYKYELETLGGSGLELMGNIPKNTLVTVLGEKSGQVHHTTVIRQSKTYNEYHGAYEISSILAKQPQWKGGANGIIINVHEKKNYLTLQTSEVTDKGLVKELDKKIRNSKELFTEIFSSKDEQKRKQNMAMARENALPVVQKVGGSEVLLITYGDNEIFGKGLLYVNDTFYPLYGECPSPPHFYKLGDTMYLRYRSGTCESGHILIFYYAILKDNVVAEWGSEGYSN